MQWGLEMQDHEKRTVAKTQLKDGTSVSTVFLGLDHNYEPTGDPILFETAIFHSNGESSIEQRYTTWKLASEGHKRILKNLLSNL
jgi:hypothetical protein